VFLDVIESVNLLAGASGNVLRSEIVGAIKMRVYLSGMPELRLGLNDKVGTVLERRVFASSNSNSGSAKIKKIVSVYRNNAAVFCPRCCSSLRGVERANQ